MSELFARDGLATTLADVARHAGVGVATVHRRFPTKDDLIYEVYEPQIRRAELIVREASRAPDAWAGFVRFFEESIDELAADKGFRELIYGASTETLGWSRRASADRLEQLMGETQQKIGRNLHKLVRRAKAAGGLRQEIEPSDLMVLSMAVQATIAIGRSVRPQLYQRVIAIIIDGMRQEPGAAAELPVAALSHRELDRARSTYRMPP